MKNWISHIVNIKLTKKQRENFAKILMDVGKLVLLTVVLGSFISEEPLNITVIIVGIIIVVICFVFAILLDK